jgi:NAD-dependent deacetylase sirtuin 4
MYVAHFTTGQYTSTNDIDKVDRLHHKASPFPASETDRRILELHGTLHFVHCPKNGHMRPRDEFQALLGELNPSWEKVVKDAHGGRVKTNPDGDVRPSLGPKLV